MTIRTILVATDFSADAARALELALELAHPTSAAVHLLHSCFLGPALPGNLPEPLGIPADFAAKIRAHARTRLEELEQQVVKAGLTCSLHLSDEAPPVDFILRTARELPADLIAMGTRGLGPIRQVLLGSVAERTVRLAPCPVLTAKAKG
jgi:nucleotide-binding universal stress UspA family protein